MKKIFALISVVFSMALCGCLQDPGASVTKDFELNGVFDELEISNAFHVYVDAKATAVSVTAGEKIMPNVVVELEEGVLKISCIPSFRVRMGELTAVIPNSLLLKEISISGASSFNSDIPLVGENLEISASGASGFYANFTAVSAEIEISGASTIESSFLADNLELELTGASKAHLTGRTDLLKLEVSGASQTSNEVVASQYLLACNRCVGSITGASKAYIHCNDRIDVSVSGASSLHFTGDANPADSSTSGASSITHDKF